MPIRPENKEFYPNDWKVRSRFIRFVRANNHCEWCGVENYSIHPETGSKIVLTTAHIFENMERPHQLLNLVALCNKCHLNYDKKKHKRNRQITKFKKVKEAGQTSFLGLPSEATIAYVATTPIINAAINNPLAQSYTVSADIFGISDTVDIILFIAVLITALLGIATIVFLIKINMQERNSKHNTILSCETKGGIMKNKQNDDVKQNQENVSVSSTDAIVSVPIKLEEQIQEMNRCVDNIANYFEKTKNIILTKKDKSEISFFVANVIIITTKAR